MSDEEKIPATLYTEKGGDNCPVDIEAYINGRGLVSIAMNEDTWLEVSPLAAKKLMAQLNRATKDTVEELVSRD